MQLHLHSSGAASRLAALLLPQIFPIFSVVAPCQPGASPPSVRRRTFTTGCYATLRRTGKIGVRMALGADRSTVIRMVLRDALMLMAAGLAVGIPAAFVASRLTAANLSGVSPTDPLIVGGALLLMLVAGVCAGLIPAIRASRID